MSNQNIPLFKVFMPPTVPDALRQTLFSGYIAEGEKTAEFSSRVSDFIGNPRTVLVNSCTTALTIAYRLAGVGPGDEVLTTPLTSVATNVPILSLGAKPVWVDSDVRTGEVDPSDVEKSITERTKAILVLHKDGDPARLDEILEIAAKHRVKVIEDAAHAFGAKYKGTKIGNHGDYVCFSFQAIKQITTGDGGAILCKDDEDYLRARKLKWFGVDKLDKSTSSPWLRDIPEWGYKGDLNDIASTIGIEQMRHIDNITSVHNRNGLLYSRLLGNIPGLTLLERSDQDFSTFWAYTILVEKREDFIMKLSQSGVQASQIHPRNDIWSMFSSSRRALPGVDFFSSREVSLPSGWWVSEEDVFRVADIVKGGW